jgi:hypothetical protein
MDPRRPNRLLIGPPNLFCVAHNATRHESLNLEGARKRGQVLFLKVWQASGQAGLSPFLTQSLFEIR